MTEMLLRDKMLDKHSAGISTTMSSVHVMEDLSITIRCIDFKKNEQFKVDIPRNLFREVIQLFFVAQGTKICVMTSRGALCTVLNVNRPYLPLTLLTRQYKHGKTLSSLVIELNITDRTQPFHYQRKD